MKTTKKKRGILAICVIVPITAVIGATAVAFMPKIIKTHKRKKYTSTY